MEAIETREKSIYCDGGSADSGQSSGHPKVFLDIPIGGDVACPYCGQKFKNIG